MKVVLYEDRLADYRVNRITALQKGFKQHGVFAPIQRIDDPVECDLAVFWGHRYSHIMEKAEDYLVLERGYWGEFPQYVSLGFNGLHGRAEHVIGDDSRWQKIGIDLAPMHSGQYILIMGQVAGDAALKGVNIWPWYNKAAESLKHWGLPIYYRQHPKQPKRKKRVPQRRSGKLESELAGAALVVTYNSTSGVDAAFAGCPVIACDKGSMAYPIAAHGFDEILTDDNRMKWAQDLAWCHWTMNEMASGEAWAHLSQRYH